MSRNEPQIRIESLDQEGRGIGHVDGKVVFVERALPGEIVTYRSFRKKASYEIAGVREIVRAGVARVKPRCPYFGVCGGCSMQHVDSRTQVAVKQRVLEDNLERIGRVKSDLILRPIHGPDWHYRLRARLSVHYAPRRGAILVGFHERKGRRVVDMQTCEILPRHVSVLLVPLRALIERLSIRDRLPQIELAVGEATTVFLLRVLAPPTLGDRIQLASFAKQHDIDFWLQPRGPDSAHPLDLPARPLAYHLSEFATRIDFLPADFTQVNHAINAVLVTRVVRLLDVGPAERVADLFCGLGNFTIPLARRAREVVGIEGQRGLTERARENAGRNGVAARCEFHTANLFETGRAELDALGFFDKMLIDPPRDGAMAVCRALAQSGTPVPRRIVYVSCNPATLARDAAILVHEANFRLVAAGVINMFPQTSHVESIAVFEPLT